VAKLVAKASRNRLALVPPKPTTARAVSEPSTRADEELTMQLVRKSP